MIEDRQAEKWFTREKRREIARVQSHADHKVHQSQRARDLKVYLKHIFALIRRGGSSHVASHELKSAFDVMDADGSGSISKTELLHALELCGEKLDQSCVISIFSEMDLDKNGRLTLHEFSTFIEKIVRRGFVHVTREKYKKKALVTMNEELSESLMSTFKAFDKDNNGYISKDELQEALFNMGVQMSESELNSLFNKFDLDHSGGIEFNEFKLLAREQLSTPENIDLWNKHHAQPIQMAPKKEDKVTVKGHLAMELLDGKRQDKREVHEKVPEGFQDISTSSSDTESDSGWEGPHGLQDPSLQQPVPHAPTFSLDSTSGPPPSSGVSVQIPTLQLSSVSPQGGQHASFASPAPSQPPMGGSFTGTTPVSDAEERMAALEREIQKTREANQQLQQQNQDILQAVGGLYPPPPMGLQAGGVDDFGQRASQEGVAGGQLDGSMMWGRGGGIASWGSGGTQEMAEPREPAWAPAWAPAVQQAPPFTPPSLSASSFPLATPLAQGTEGSVAKQAAHDEAAAVLKALSVQRDVQQRAQGWRLRGAHMILDSMERLEKAGEKMSPRGAVECGTHVRAMGSTCDHLLQSFSDSHISNTPPVHISPYKSSPLTYAPKHASLSACNTSDVSTAMGIVVDRNTFARTPTDWRLQHASSLDTLRAERIAMNSAQPPMTLYHRLNRTLSSVELARGRWSESTPDLHGRHKP